MRIAMIGGTVFIGHAAACDAVDRGHDVTCIHRGVHPNEVEGAVSLFAHRSDPHALASALKKSAPDVVIDTRSLTRRDAEIAVAAERDVDAPVVVLSSQDVYAQFGSLIGHPAPPPEEQVTEDAPLTVPYPFRGKRKHSGGADYDKKDVETVYRSSGLAVTVLRLPATYGPRDPQRRFGWALDAMDEGIREFPHRGGGLWRWTHADVRDVGRAIVLAAESTPSRFEIYNVGEEETPTMRHRVEHFAEHLGATLSWQESDTGLPSRFAYLDDDRHDFVVSSERIRSQLGFQEVTSPEERLRGLVDWLRASRNSHSESSGRSR